MGKTFSTGLLTNGLWQDASNNIGIGGSPSGSYKLQVTGASLFTGADLATDGLGNVNIFTTDAAATGKGGSLAFGGGTTGGTSPYAFAKIEGIYDGSAAYNGAMLFSTNNGGTIAERMRITSAGNIGIGTTFNITPYFNTGQSSGVLQIATNISKNSTASTESYPVAFFGSNDSSQPLGLYFGIITGNSGTASRKLKIQGTEIGLSANDIVMQSDGGKLVINASSSFPNSLLTAVANSSQPYPIGAKGTDASQGLIGFFDGSNNIIGNVFRSNSSVQYNTSSDYRLKEDLKDVNGLEKVSAIKIYDFKWKGYDSRTDGVLAHELQEVLPYAVNGIKDAVNEDGSIIPQGVDYSKLVPVLVKAIQELSAKVSALENKS